LRLYRVPGAVVGVYAAGREETATLGVAGIASDEAVRPETRFQMGSVNKVYTATAIMRLAEAGKIDLDAQVQDYVPNLDLQEETTTGSVTIRDLLTHSGGWWGDAFVDTGTGDDAVARYVEEVLPRLPQVAPVGEYFSYNNSGFVLLGRVIEEVTGTDYRSAMQELVLDPLGLDSAAFEESTILAGPYAEGHGLGTEGAVEKVTPLSLPRSLEPAGGLWITVADQLEFARLHLGEGPADVLSEDSIAAMQEAQLPFSGQPGARIAQPWVTADLDGMTIVDHEGGTFGQSAKLTLIPEESFAIAVFTNSQSGSEVGQVALLEALRQYFDYAPETGDPSQTNEQGLPPTVAPLPVSDLKQYEGHYQVPVGAYDLRVEGTELIARYTPLRFEGQIEPSNVGAINYPPLTVQFVADDVAIVGGISVISFLRREDGDVGWLVELGRLYPRSE
jgi:CubicO group peptidase (beta-lactamase class C family)